MLKQPNPAQTHCSCTRESCLAHHVDEASYKPKRTDPDCRCAFTGPRIEEVAQILDEGDIPVIAIKPVESNQMPSIHVVRHKPGHKESSPYVAISHVWGGWTGKCE